MKLVKVFFSGLLISFIGSLPLGTLNVATFQISVTVGVVQAIWFALGCMLTEIAYVRVSFVAIDKIRKHTGFFKFMNFFIFFITVCLAVFAFTSESANNPAFSLFPLMNITQALLLGLTLSAVNLAQIPFWLAFSSVLLSKKILLPLNSHYNWYIIGIAIGSMIASSFFIFGGQLILKNISSNQAVISKIIGISFSIAAIVQLWRLFSIKK